MFLGLVGGPERVERRAKAHACRGQLSVVAWRPRHSTDALCYSLSAAAAPLTHYVIVCRPAATLFWLVIGTDARRQATTELRG
ncbi:hypothetical protein BHE74_00000252 [Ensete ventricosum]|nr:hypothetical protein BHE74_00000252 [Ensete ventricosum]